MEKLFSLLGLVVFVGAAWILSEDRRSVSWRLVAWGLGLQFLFAVLILKTRAGLLVFDAAQVVMTRLLQYTDHGSRFLFGALVDDPQIGALVAFKVLPVIIFVSSIMGVLNYLGIVQVVVRAMARVMQWTMKASGAEALMAAVYVFMGIEGTTGVRDYLPEMTRSELFAVMSGFMATIAGSVMAVYVSFGASAGHLLAASVMSAPAALVTAKLMVPETGTPGAGGGEVYSGALKTDDVNIVEAAANGAGQGLRLAATIGAMLLAFVAIIGMLDSFLLYFGTSFGALSGFVLSPVAFVMGVPWKDCTLVGELLGIKVIFNEFISFQRMQTLIAEGALEPRSVTIATYALCSFGNFGSIAILMGGLGTLAPGRKKDIARLSMKALLAGVMASFMTATVAGVLS